MSGRYSRERGKRGERMWRDMLREAGFLKAHRGVQYCGSKDSPDVVCSELPGIHFEVKNTETLSVYAAMQQAREDAGVKIPVVAHKRNDHPWLVIMLASDWLNLIKETEQVKVEVE